MATARPCSRCARFDKFEVDLAAGELRKSGQRVALQDQPFQILRLLIESAPEVVTRERISSVLWPSDTFVDFDLAINTAVRKLRQALDDSVDQPKFVQTLAKKGYRFIGNVEWIGRFDKSFCRRPQRRIARPDTNPTGWRMDAGDRSDLFSQSLATVGLRGHWQSPKAILTAVPLTVFSMETQDGRPFPQMDSKSRSAWDTNHWSFSFRLVNRGSGLRTVCS